MHTAIAGVVFECNGSPTVDSHRSFCQGWISFQFLVAISAGMALDIQTGDTGQDGCATCDSDEVVYEAEKLPAHLIDQRFELVNVFKAAVHTGKSNVGHFVELLELSHHQFTHAGRRQLFHAQCE